MLKAQLYRIFIVLLGQLPLGLLRAVGSKLGTLAWLTRSRMWLVTQENIDLCYPELDAHRRLVLSKESLRETAQTMTETTFAWCRPTHTVLKTISDVVGQDRVDAAKLENNGVVFVIPHLGNWEIINHYLGEQYGLTHMFQPNRNKRLSTYIQSRREKTGTQFVPTDISGVRQQLKVLKSGGCIGIMPDQEPLVHTGQFAPFYGIDALTNELVRGYTNRGARMFVAVCVRQPLGFTIRFDPIPNTSSETVVAQLNLSVEQAIRRNPSQYLWSYKRFRTRPDGELDYYQFDRHPVRTIIESIGLALYCCVFRQLPKSLDQPLAKFLSILPLVMKKRRKIAKINVALTKHSSKFASNSIATTIQAAIEAPRIWQCSAMRFSQQISSENEAALKLESGPNTTDQTTQHVLASGAIVLTPPLGSREFLLRYLCLQNQVTEYYHCNSITSLDRLIRSKRTGCGIRLVGHTDDGREQLRQALSKDTIITMCPDQQPRLRGGVFVPFFNTPALTTTALPELLRECQPNLFLGYAVREKGNFKYKIKLEPITVDSSQSNEVILTTIHKKIENAIDAYPDQYRWSDKRFNIQPLGHKKLYR